MKNIFILIAALPFDLISRVISASCPEALNAINHFRGGSGKNYEIDFQEIIQSDQGLRSAIRMQITSSSSGVAFISQHHFSLFSSRLLLGGISIYWQRVDNVFVLSFKKFYTWSPGELRISWPFHFAGYFLEKHGNAKSFTMLGHAIISKTEKSRSMKEKRTNHLRFFLL